MQNGSDALEGGVCHPTEAQSRPRETEQATPRCLSPQQTEPSTPARAAPPRLRGQGPILPSHQHRRPPTPPGNVMKHTRPALGSWKPFFVSRCPPVKQG